MKQEQYRRAQILAVASGVFSFLAALAGGVVEYRLLAWAGLAGFVLALAAVIVLGIAAWRRFD
jgi:hypothetical protein